MRSRSHTALSIGLACVTVLSACSSHQSEEKTSPEAAGASVSTVTSTATVSSTTTVSSSGETSSTPAPSDSNSGATGSFDYQQRHFTFTHFDDSIYKIGQYGTDFMGQPVFIPHNPNGDPFGDVVKHDELDCNPPESIEAQQQYVHGRYILVSKHDGPSNFSTPIPNGYAKSITGAAVAASNIVTFALDYADEPSLNFLKENIDVPGLKEAAEKIPQTGYMGPFPSPSMSGFKVVSCGGDIVTVKIAFLGKDKDQDGNIKDAWSIYRMPLRWDNGKWVATMSKQEYNTMSNESTFSLNGFIKVNYK